MDNNIALRVTGLETKYYVGRRTVNAVSGASFVLPRGQTLGIVGESGCGKSATAHSILQLLPKNGKVTGGTVEYFPPEGPAVTLSSLGPKSRAMRSLRGADISMIFQDPLSSLNPVYTVGRQITEMLTAHEHISRQKARERGVALLGKLGIPRPEARFDDYPHQFSGGMKQRVMIAIAMVCNPHILIADEPTTALDVTIQAQILELMSDLQKEWGTSILLITHNMGIVAEMCHRVAVMYMGRVVEEGSLEQVFTAPLHPYTIALMEAVPVLGMGRDKPLRAIPGTTPDGAAVFAGCPFAPRCSRAGEVCFARPPEDRVDSLGHRVACHMAKGGAQG